MQSPAKAPLRPRPTPHGRFQGFDQAMRPNQQNNKNRQRGRGNNNGGRKHPNPLSRNYESNGPDVKVRGNAAHIAERYVQLARDALASGDSVMAENYYQHAEHYFRIVSAAQPQGVPLPGQSQDYDGDDDDGEDVVDPMEPHARIVEVEPREQRTFREDRGERQDRGERSYREDRGNRDDQRPVREDRPVRAEIAAPVSEAPEESDSGEAVMAAAEGEEAPRRRRQRRRRPAGGEGAPAEGGDDAAPELPAFLTAGGTTAAE